MEATRAMRGSDERVDVGIVRVASAERAEVSVTMVVKIMCGCHDTCIYSEVFTLIDIYAQKGTILTHIPEKNGKGMILVAKTDISKKPLLRITMQFEIMFLRFVHPLPEAMHLGLFDNECLKIRRYLRVLNNCLIFVVACYCPFIISLI